MKSYRFLAYALVFVAGAAVMFAVDRTLLLPSTSVSQSRQVSQPASEPPRREVLKPTPMTVVPSEENQPEKAEAPSPEKPELKESNELCIQGITEPAPGRHAKLPLATSQPVAFVDVKLGDRVKKGWQVFSHWESPERLQAVKAELEKTKKQLEVAKSRGAAAKQSIERLEKLKSAVAGQEIEDARSMVQIRQGELETAQQAVAAAESHFTAMEFEFNQAFVTSPLDGVVASVDVFPGERRQLSGNFRGVIVIDPRVLNCRCFVDEQQLAALEQKDGSAGREETDSKSGTANDSQNAESGDVKVRFDGKEWNAKLLSIGILADSVTGRIPVILEIRNPDETLRSGIKVTACFRKHLDPEAEKRGN